MDLYQILMLNIICQRTKAPINLVRKGRTKKATNKVMLRIAQLKIDAYKLNVTPKDYVKKAKTLDIPKTVV